MHNVTATEGKKTLLPFSFTTVDNRTEHLKRLLWAVVAASDSYPFSHFCSYGVASNLLSRLATY